MNLPPFRDPGYVEPKVEVERRPDGSIVLRNPHPLRAVPANLIQPIRKWAAEAPDRVWLGKRRAAKEGLGSWELLTYADANRKVSAIAQALLDRGFNQQTPVMILSGNSIEHALMTYGAILAGVPVAPVSPSYSTMSSDFEKLRYVVDLIEPKLIFMQESAPFARGLAALDLNGVELVTVDASRGTSFSDLTDTAPGEAVEQSYARLAPGMVAKYLFTSGSTGMPKAVITTQEMMCVNSVMPKSVTLEEENEEPPVLLNWLPWNHCFGGNAILNNLLVAGGTLYIDGGRPVPGGFAETVANLREIAPTAYSNVPAAYTMLADELERDDELAKNFFSRLRTLAYGGAALSQDLYERIQRVAIRAVGERIAFSSGYGATETAPTITNVHWPTERMGLLGLPLPGIELKLAPVGLKMEVRVRGACITKGYYKNPEKTRDAYDEEGFYRLGDGARFVNPDNPLEGLVFDGRVAEDFKLDTGTWVQAGKLRVDLVGAAAPVIQDAVICGHDRKYVAALAWPNWVGLPKVVTDEAAQSSLDTMLNSSQLLEHVRAGVRAHNRANPGSSTAIKRVLFMAEPPSMDGGEITDKGYINQKAALTRRAHLVEKLYADPPGNDVIVI